MLTFFLKITSKVTDAAQHGLDSHVIYLHASQASLLMKKIVSVGMLALINIRHLNL